MSSLSLTERPVHGVDWMLTPAAETTHQAPPKWTRPWPLTCPAFRASIQPYFVAPPVRTLLPSRRRTGIEPA